LETFSSERQVDARVQALVTGGSRPGDITYYEKKPRTVAVTTRITLG
jgi:hypothetical protein